MCHNLSSNFFEYTHTHKILLFALAAVKATVAVDLKGNTFALALVGFAISKSSTLSFVCPVQRWRDKLSFALSGKSAGWLRSSQIRDFVVYNNKSR